MDDGEGAGEVPAAVSTASLNVVDHSPAGARARAGLRPMVVPGGGGGGGAQDPEADGGVGGDEAAPGFELGLLWWSADGEHDDGDGERVDGVDGDEFEQAAGPLWAGMPLAMFDAAVVDPAVFDDGFA